MVKNRRDESLRSDYLSYLLRLWRVEVSERTLWRASLECPHTGEQLGERSAAIQAWVEAAREAQRQRFEGTGLRSNADAPACAGVGPAEVRDHCQVDEAGKSLQRPVPTRTPRESERILKLARTIADPSETQGRPGGE